MRCSDVDFESGNFVLIKGLDHSYDDNDVVNAGRYDLAYSSSSQLWELNNETPNNEIILEEGTIYYYNVNVAGMIYVDEEGEDLDEPFWTEWKNFEVFEGADTCLGQLPDSGDYKRTLSFTREDLDGNGNYKIETVRPNIIAPSGWSHNFMPYGNFEL